MPYLILATLATLDCVANAYIGRPLRACLSPAVVILIIAGVQS